MSEILNSKSTGVLLHEAQNRIENLVQIVNLQRDEIASIQKQLNEKDQEIKQLQSMITNMAKRIAGQSDQLSMNAMKAKEAEFKVMLEVRKFIISYQDNPNSDRTICKLKELMKLTEKITIPDPI